MIGIYKITNIITKKYYIGQSGRLEQRLSNHKRIAFMPTSKQYNDELYKDIRKYGIENFKFEILEKVDITELEEKLIQQELLKNSNIYNKNFFPYSDSGNCCRKLDEHQISEIIQLLKENKISNIEIAKRFDCSAGTIDNINNGKSYIQDNMIYPIRVYAKAIGENNPNSMYSDKEIIELRKQYVYKTIRQLYNESDKRIGYACFERNIIGMSCKHLPVYKKRKNKWYLGNSCID